MERCGKRGEPPRNKEGFSGRFNHPTKTVTENEVIQKVKTEAKAARAKVPPDMRAERYSFEDSGAPKQKNGFSSQFKNAGQTATEDKSAKMSSAFNGASEANKPEKEPRPTGPESKW